MSNTPSQAHLLPAEFHIWHFCPLSHSNLSFWLLSPRDISSVFFIAKLKEIPGIREMAVAYFFVETESPSSPQNPLCRCICPLSLLTVLAPFSHALGENPPRKPKLKDKLQKDTASLFFSLLFFSDQAPNLQLFCLFSSSQEAYFCFSTASLDPRAFGS